MLHILGDYKEGGGAILRLALALSVLTNKPFKIKDIRKGRSNPGLQEQHLQAVKAVASLCNAELEGASLHSTELTFIPKEITKKKLKINIGTAGSTALVLQPLLMVGTRNDLQIDINGGATFNKFAPTLLYIQHVLAPLLKRMSYNIRLNVIKEGFFPKGGAKINISLQQAKLKPLNLEKRGTLLKIYGFSYASSILKERRVAERQSIAAKKILSNYDIQIQNYYADTLCPGSGILLIAEYENTTLGYDALGERTKRAEEVGNEAALGLLKQVDSKATVDEFMSDQILPYLALCRENSIIRIPRLTSHAETNIWLIKQFLDVNFKIENNTLYIN